MSNDVLFPIAIPIVIFLVWLFNCLNILREYERAVVFRLGRVLKHEKGPGLVLILWPIDKIVKVSLRVVTWDVPPQDIITRDNVSLKVNAVVYFRVINATKAINTPVCPTYPPCRDTSPSNPEQHRRHARCPPG